MEENKWLCVGKIVGAKGLKGELKVNPSSDFPERFLIPGERWLLNDKQEIHRIQLEKGRKVPGKSIYIISIEGITDRNLAERFIGQEILISSSDRPKLKEGEFHLIDLLELDVKLLSNQKTIGKIKGLTSAGNDLLEIKLNNGKMVLIPFVDSIVPQISIKEKCIRINPPEGLLEL